MAAALFFGVALLLQVQTAAPATVAWRDDAVSVTVDGGISVAGVTAGVAVEVALQAGHAVLPSETGAGHWSLQVGEEDANASSCFEWHISEETLETALNRLVTVKAAGGVTVSSFGNASHGTWSYGYRHSLVFGNTTGRAPNFADPTGTALRTFDLRIAHVGTGHCDAVRTHGSWEDAENWAPPLVPGSADDVVIPADAGFVALGESATTVGSLAMSGGALVLQKSACPNGWAKPQYGDLDGFAFGGGIWTQCYAAFRGGGAAPAADSETRVGGFGDTIHGHVDASTSESYVADGYGGFFGTMPYGATWAEAETLCRAASPGAAGHLVMITSQEENELVKDLCGGLGRASFAGEGTADTTDLADPSCWIGLSREHSYGAGGWAWVDEDEGTQVKKEPTWRAWARHEPNNRTHVDGGEGCATMKGALYDPEYQYEGRWNDERCGNRFSYVCERFATSTSYELVVAGAFDWHGGFLSGGGTLLVEGTATVDGAVSASTGAMMGLTDAARLELLGASSWERPAGYAALTVHAGDGATVVNNGTMALDTGVTLAASAGAGLAPLADDGRGISTDANGHVTTTRPVLGGRRPRLWNAGILTVSEASASSATLSGIDWFFDNAGTVTANSDLELSGGAGLVQGTLDISAGVDVTLSNYSSSASQAPAMSLTIEAPLQVVGEERSFDRVDTKYPDRTDASAEVFLGTGRAGTYRLEVHREGYTSAFTTCIPFHASAARVQRDLEALPIVQSLGGVTVTKDGDGMPGRWSNGYRYRLDFDGFDLTRGSGRESIDSVRSGMEGTTVGLKCQGSRGSCGCVDVVSPLDLNKDVQYGCGKGHNTTVTDPDTCTITPTFTVASLATGGEGEVAGSGTLVLIGGVHRLAGTITSDLTVSGGYALAASSNVTYSGGVTVDGDGVLMLAGGAFEGLDNALLLYEDADGQGRPERPRKPMNAAVGTLTVAGAGQLRIGTDGHNIGRVTVGTMDMSAGTLTGWATLTVTNSLIMSSSSTKYVKSALQVVCAAGASCSWEAGDVMLSEGAGVINRGTMTFSPAAGEVMGDDDTQAGWVQGRQWSQYVGWYTNPLCGRYCDRPPYLLNLASLHVASLSSAAVSLTLRNRGDLAVGPSAVLDLSGGGEGAKGSLLIEGKLRLSGGTFTLERDSPLLQNGTLEVTGGGSHLLPDTVWPRLVITGGLVESRSRQQDLNGGLEIHGSGVLAYTVSNALITVRNRNFTMSGGELQFVEVLPSAAVRSEHIHTDPRNADRSYMTLNTKLVWSGGKMRGNAEIGGRDGMHLGGGVKRLEMLLHLINYEVLLWDTGDVLLTESADLINAGTIEMKHPSQFDAKITYDGHYEDAGVFPERQLHMWEDADSAIHPNHIGATARRIR